MAHIIHELRKLRHKSKKQAPKRGKLPDVSLRQNEIVFVLPWVFAVATLVGFLASIALLLYGGLGLGHAAHVVGRTVGVPGAWWLPSGPLRTVEDAGVLGATFGVLAVVLYAVLPVGYGAAFALWHRQRPSRETFGHFSTEQNTLGVCALALGVWYGINHTLPAVVYFFHFGRWPSGLALAPYITVWWQSAAIAAGVGVVLAVGLYFLLPKHPVLYPVSRKTQFNGLSGGDAVQAAGNGFSLWLGRSTGTLVRLWHCTGLAPNIELALSLEDAAQNLVVLGGIGSGKTTRMVQPLLAQLLDQDCGGLLFDVKGDVKRTAAKLAEMTGRHVQFIGPGHRPMNLLTGLTPEVAASFLKSALLLDGKSSEPFWVVTATDVCRHALGALSFLPVHYSLQGLYRYVFYVEHRRTVDTELEQLLPTLSTKNQELLSQYLGYQQQVFDKFEEKTKSGVMATLSQVLSGFTHPDIAGAFCQQTTDSLSMEAVLDGAVYLVDVPLSQWGQSGKLAYTFLKLRFFNVMQGRNQQVNANQHRPVFFMCDEYQELVSANKDGLSDLNFWDKSRSSKTIGIISAQSVSSFHAALGNHDLTNALLQNFRQKVCFRTEDTDTLALMDSLAGRAKVLRKTQSQTKGNSTNTAKTSSSSKHRSGSDSITEAREAVLDAALFRNLKVNQAVALLSLKGESMDDVLELMPVYLD